MVERVSGCWQQVALGVVDGSGWWWLEAKHCLLMIMPKLNAQGASGFHCQVKRK